RQVTNLRTSSQTNIFTTDSNESSVIGEGSLSLSNTLNLDSVLIVPSLDYNLLYVFQITKALSCIVIFWPDFCVFKDIQTKQTIGCGVRRGKLYYLDLTSMSSNKLYEVLVVRGIKEKKRESKIWLWH